MNNFVLATIISFMYLIVKFIEMRFIEKENKPLKYLVRDCLLVYFSIMIGLVVIEQIDPEVLVEAGTSTPIQPSMSVFTDNPAF